MLAETVILCATQVVPERRCEGEATVHPAGLLHGVTKLRGRGSQAGGGGGGEERFSMIMFFENPQRLA